MENAAFRRDVLLLCSAQEALHELGRIKAIADKIGPPGAAPEECGEMASVVSTVVDLRRVLIDKIRGYEVARSHGLRDALTASGRG